MIASVSHKVRGWVPNAHALRRQQLLDGENDKAAQLVVEGFLLRSGSRVRLRGQHRFRRFSRQHAVLLQGGAQGAVGDDTIEPGSEWTSGIKLGDVLVDQHEGVGDRILSAGLIAGDGVGRT
jgi:hypothetical protein